MDEVSNRKWEVSELDLGDTTSCFITNKCRSKYSCLKKYKEAGKYWGVMMASVLQM